MVFYADDIKNLPSRQRALFINSLSGFKSANLVGTCNTNYYSNLSMISSVVHIGSNPPLLAMIIRPHSVARHTLENIINTQYYTINHVNETIYQQAHQTSARYAINESEFKAVGLTELWQENFSAPFVKESRVKMGMKLREHIHLSVNKTEMIIGEIIRVYVTDDIICDDGYVNIEQSGTVAVSSLDSYHSTSLLSHLAYAKPSMPIKKLNRSLGDKA